MAHRLFFVLLWLLAACLAHPGAAAAQTNAAPIVAEGKAVCSLQRLVPFPFFGRVVEVRADVGQAVAKGDVLATYRMTADNAAIVRRILTRQPVRELETHAFDLQRGLRQAEVALAEARRLSTQNLASTQSLQRLEEECESARLKLDGIEERLSAERQIADQEISELADLFGQPLDLDHLPEVFQVVTPIDGRVISVDGEIRPDSLVPSHGPFFLVGRMDPMSILTRIHETDTARVRPGTRARFTASALPGQEFEATVVRVSWTPVSLDIEHPTYYPVELSVSNPDLLIRQGFKGYVTFLPDAETRPQGATD